MLQADIKILFNLGRYVFLTAGGSYFRVLSFYVIGQAAGMDKVGNDLGEAGRQASNR
jgi:hypothetical protein